MDGIQSPTSVYFSAQSSDSDPASHPFQTPFTRRARSDVDAQKEDDNQSTPRANYPVLSADSQLLVPSNDDIGSGLTPLLLRRYIDHERSWSDLSSTPTISSTRPMTRLQERKQAAQESPAASTPVQPSSATIDQGRNLRSRGTPRTPVQPAFPLIQSHLLRDVSPHSPTYASNLGKAVDGVVESLVQHGRIKESHGMHELYQQSFNDPGSKELLEALLRQRPNERQMRDFLRYVADVDRLREEQAIVLSTPATALDEGTPKIIPSAASTIRKLVSPRVVISTPAHRLPASHTAIPYESNFAPNGHAADPAPRFEQSLTPETALPKASEPQRGRGSSTSHTRNRASAHFQLLEDIESRARKRALRKCEARTMFVRAIEANAKAGNEHLGPTGYQPRRKKIKKSRMFLGANGPVYCSSYLDLPFATHLVSRWR